MTRLRVLQALADLIEARGPSHGILRVAIDGVDGAGKTVLGDELAGTLRGRGLDVVRAGVDGFHHPPAIRYQQGRDSPRGYYEDSYDYAALRRELLEPLSANGSRVYRTAVYDVRREASLSQQPSTAPVGAVLVFDGIFLHRPQLRGFWDLSVYVDVPFAVSVPRGAARGYGHPDPGDPSNRRYVEGQQWYLAECTPASRADVALDNSDLAHPVLLRPR